VFTSDNIFHKVHTWLQEANPDLWLVTLESLRSLKEEVFVPGHGPVCARNISTSKVVHPGMESVREECDRQRHVER
jgi:glyoxylase-like metal-dependent hydrolase (beta-lactamase superfamily II)